MIKICGSALIMTLFALTAQSQVVLDFNFTGVNSPVPPGNQLGPVTATSTLSTNLSVADGFQPFGLGPPVVADSIAAESSGAGGQGPDEMSLRGFGENGLATAITANDYAFFSVNIGSGYQMDLDTISFNIRRNGNAAPEDYAILASPSGFTASSELQTFEVTTSSSSPLTNVETLSVDVSSLATYDGLTGNDVEFRLYAWGSGVGNFHVSDASLSGQIAVIPEPSTFALLASGIGVVLLGSRRRRKS